MITAYTTTMRVAAQIPKEDIGIIGFIAFAKNAAEVVLEVVAVAREALRKEQASLLLISLPIYLLLALWRQPSMKTKMSSAAMPKTMKMVNECKVLQNVF